jgi:DNA-binding transcriptional regulator LsrR (DeoR family)
MIYDDAHALLMRVAWLYYVEQFSQQEIADRMRISRMRVTRLLQRARDENVVEIRITSSSEPWLTMERDLVARFGLRDAIVVPSDGGERLRRHLAQAAAAYLERILCDDDVIGIGSGATLSEIPVFIRRGSHPRCTVVELIGGLSRTDRTINPYDCSWRLAEALGAHSEHLQVPAMVENAAIAQILREDSETRAALDRAAACTVAVVGIGQMNSPIRASMDYVAPESLPVLLAAGAAGDILLRFYNAEGSALQTGFDDQILGITLDQLQKIPLVIGVAGGPEKVEAIAGALRGGLVDVIICDQGAAAEILALAAVPSHSIAAGC